jgi:hypothetical protein
VSLQLQPINFREASDFIARHHRHHKPPVGHKFSLAVNDGSEVVGVAVVGRPVARMSDDGWTAEITRLCVIEGHRNAASMLLGACWRAAKAMGYRRLITYTLPEEGGASLRGADYRLVGIAGGGSWNRESRPRVDKAPTGQKHLWEKT